MTFDPVSLEREDTLAFLRSMADQVAAATHQRHPAVIALREAAHSIEKARHVGASRSPRRELELIKAVLGDEAEDDNV